MIKIKYFIFLLFFVVGVTAKVSALTYTTDGKNSWTPSTPGNSITSSDIFIINHQVTLYGLTLDNGGEIIINSGGNLSLKWSANFQQGSTIQINSGGTLNISQLTLTNYSDNFVIDGAINTSNGTMVNYASGIIEYNAGASWSMNQFTLTNHGDMVLNEDADWKNGTVQFTSGTVEINKEITIKNLTLQNNANIIGYGQIDLQNGNGTFQSNGTINGCSGQGCIPPSTVGTVTYLAAPLTTPGNTIEPYDGGSLPSSDCNKTVQVIDDLIISSDVQYGDLIVPPGVTVTIEENQTLSICNSIANGGVVYLENKGSLVQTSASDENSGDGKYILERKVSGSVNAYNSWSSPLQSAEIAEVFSGANPCDIFAFNGATQSWEYDYPMNYSTSCNGNQVTFTSGLLPGSDGLMDKGRGYFVPGTATQSRTIEGTVNNGDVTIDVYSTSLGNHPDWNLDDWNLVGNPYPCAIDLEKFYLANESVVTGSFYFWVDDNQGGTDYHYSSDYAVYANQVGTSANGGTAQQYVAAGQAFWVFAKGNGQVTFSNSMRTVGNNSDLLKTDQTDAKGFVYLDITNDSNSYNQCAVGYHSNSTNGFDEASDAPKEDGGTGVSIASIIDGNPYAIQAFEELGEFDSYSVPLLVRTLWAGNHTFHVSKIDGVKSNVDVSLLDNTTGIVTNVKNVDYTLYLDTGNYVGRFELLFENTGTPLTVGDVDAGQIEFQAYQSEQNIVVETNDDQNELEYVVVYDLMGKELMTLNSQSSKVVLDASQLATGVYLIKGKLVSGNIFTEKVTFTK